MEELAVSIRFSIVAGSDLLHCSQYLTTTALLKHTVTPMQSICNQLLYEHAKGRRELEDVKLVWVERDPVLMKSVDVVRQSNAAFESRRSMRQFSSEETAPLQNFKGHSVPLASTLLSMIPPSQTTDEQLEEMYESQLGLQITDDDEEEFYEAHRRKSDSFDWPSSMNMSANLFDSRHRSANNIPNTIEEMEEYAGPPQPVVQVEDLDSDATSVATETFPFKQTHVAHGPKPVEDVLDMHVHLTGKVSLSAESEHNLPGIKYGRPKIAEILSQTREQAASLGHKRVAVLVCAPRGIAEICRKACIKLTNRKVRFDYHEEGFA